MHALVHRSLTDAPEIFLTVVSIFSIGFLLWFLVGLLREERRIGTRQVRIFRVNGGRVLKFEHRDHPGEYAAPRARSIKVTGEVGEVQVSSTPDQRSPKVAVKMHWLIMCLLLSLGI